MTTKYESVLSESERNRICIQASAGKQGLQSDRSVSRATEQAVLAKLQPQLDAIGAGGVSGQRVMKTRIPAGYKLVPIELTEDMVDASGCEGQFKLSPSDQAQRLWSAMLSASPTPDIKDPLTTENQELRIVFSGEAPNLTFIDVENEDGFSVNAGQWHKRFDGYTELRIKAAKE